MSISDICLHSYLDENCLECWKRECNRGWQWFRNLVDWVGGVDVPIQQLNRKDIKMERHDYAPGAVIFRTNGSEFGDGLLSHPAVERRYRLGSFPAEDLCENCTHERQRHGRDGWCRYEYDRHRGEVCDCVQFEFGLVR